MMPTYLFEITDNARNTCLVLGTGADVDAAMTDADTKWDAAEADDNRKPKAGIRLMGQSTDAPEDTGQPVLIP